MWFGTWCTLNDDDDDGDDDDICHVIDNTAYCLKYGFLGTISSGISTRESKICKICKSYTIAEGQKVDGERCAFTIIRDRPALQWHAVNAVFRAARTEMGDAQRMFTAREGAVAKYKN